MLELLATLILLGLLLGLGFRVFEALPDSKELVEWVVWAVLLAVMLWLKAIL